MFRQHFGKWTLAALGLALSWTASAQEPTAPEKLSAIPSIAGKAPTAPADVLAARYQPVPPPPPPDGGTVSPQAPPIQAPPTSAIAPAPAPETTGRSSEIGAGGGSSTVVGGASTPGQAAPAATSAQNLNATDVGGLLAKSDSAAGVEVQRRNAIIVDPRLRGLRNGQFLTTGDGAPFFPARLDLDTPVSKFDPGTVRAVNVIRGPYSAQLGPGFGFLDILTVATPRATDGKSTIYGGTSSLGFQTNGSQWNGLQSAYAGGENWGFRGTYNVLQGSDYRAGDGTKIPASYTSHNFNFGLGYDISPTTTIEFRGLRSWLEDVEFPGLFFDIARSDTEAYNLSLTSRDVGPFDLVTGTVWYNSTTGRGDTAGGAKQFFVQNLLGEAFFEGLPSSRVRGLGANGQQGNFYSPFVFQDESTSRFAERSIGYRLAGQWGNNQDQLTITVGTDLNAFGQSLTENIRFRQIGGSVNSTNGQLISAANPLPTVPFLQTQSIPSSNAVDTGLFIESMLPIHDAFRFRSGGRMDFVRASSNARNISGNIDLFGRFNEIPRPLSGERISFDPLIYSVDPRSGKLDRDFFLLSGFLTSEYQLSKEATLFVGYGYAERAPTLTELYATGPFVGVLQQGTSRLIGDPNLSKERLNQFDLGLRYNNEWLKAGISGFYAFINDYITYDANKLSNNGLTQVVFTNTDLATLAGTEMYLQANVNRWLTPFATLAYVQGIDQTHADRRRNPSLASSRRNDVTQRVFASQTEALPQIPPMETRLGFRVHQAVDNNVDPRWQVEFASRIVNGQNNVAASLGEQVTPGFTTFDIRGFWKVRDSWLLTAGVENIGDILYREHLDPFASTRLRANTNIPVAPLFRPGTNFFFASQLTY